MRLPCNSFAREILTQIGLATSLLLTALSIEPVAVAETFDFGVGATFGTTRNGLTGQHEATVTRGDFAMHLSAGPESMAGLVENAFARGLGVDSGAAGGSANSFEVLGGASPGIGEYIEFSFDRPGKITGVNLDGVKDELLEYFHLESTGGVNSYFFDSHANMPDFAHPMFEHPLDAAVNGGAIVGNIVLLREEGTLDDEIYGLEIPFVAGQVFRLSFNSVGAPYSQGVANGARLYAIEVQGVPEPATLTLVGLLLAAFAAVRLLRG